MLTHAYAGIQKLRVQNWFWTPAFAGVSGNWNSAFTPMFLVFAVQFPDDGLGTYGVAETISS